MYRKFTKYCFCLKPFIVLYYIIFTATFNASFQVIQILISLKKINTYTCSIDFNLKGQITRETQQFSLCKNKLNTLITKIYKTDLTQLDNKLTAQGLNFQILIKIIVFNDGY